MKSRNMVKRLKRDEKWGGAYFYTLHIHTFSKKSFFIVCESKWDDKAKVTKYIS